MGKSVYLAYITALNCAVYIRVLLIAAIVMCLLLYKRMDKQDEQHKAEMDKLTDALNNNTLALQELSLRLSKDAE